MKSGSDTVFSVIRDGIAFNGFAIEVRDTV